jgi:hypothetical protein
MFALEHLKSPVTLTAVRLENEGGGHSVANVKRMELKKPGSERDPAPSEDVFKRGVRRR